MCRWIGQLGSDRATLIDDLVESPTSLLKLSHVRPTALQADGWGIAWWDGRLGLQRVVGTGGAFEPAESPRFRATARKAQGPVIVGHLRRASNPMGRPAAELIGEANSQPFTDGSYIFAHNGMIPHPETTRRRLGRFHDRVRGVNDSEILFWLLRAHLDSDDDIVAAFGRSVADLRDDWRSEGSPIAGPYSGLNVLWTRGTDDLWAFCLSRGDHGPGLADRDRPYYRLAFRAESDRIKVASEPTDGHPGWGSLENGHYLHARRSSSGIRWESGPIPGLAPEDLAPAP
ncbi:MAG: class II glutamine amidotransferase [Thermoplasmata archaeon]